MEDSYYGRLTGPLLGDNVGIYCVDQAFERLLAKYEDKLIARQQKLIESLRITFLKDQQHAQKVIKGLVERVAALEKVKYKDKI